MFKVHTPRVMCISAWKGTNMLYVCTRTIRWTNFCSRAHTCRHLHFRKETHDKVYLVRDNIYLSLSHSLSFSLFIVWFFGRYTSFIRLSIFVARTLTRSLVRSFTSLSYFARALCCVVIYVFVTYSISISILKKMNFSTNCCNMYVGVDPFQCVYLFCIAVSSFPFFPFFFAFQFTEIGNTSVRGIYTGRVCIGMNMKDTSMDAMNFVHQTPKCHRKCAITHNNPKKIERKIIHAQHVIIMETKGIKRLWAKEHKQERIILFRLMNFVRRNKMRLSGWLIILDEFYWLILLLLAAKKSRTFAIFITIKIERSRTTQTGKFAWNSSAA